MAARGRMHRAEALSMMLPSSARHPTTASFINTALLRSEGQLSGGFPPQTPLGAALPGCFAQRIHPNHYGRQLLPVRHPRPVQETAAVPRPSRHPSCCRHRRPHWRLCALVVATGGDCGYKMHSDASPKTIPHSYGEMSDGTSSPLS
eukprot:CAMPEP_0173459788 /NCGR_PEP_ID=MMETSP1357-20121228/62033_1 /TAXON_ID=77926 /ORGANISM="Hemiselmis rufescens, Strain PCC563" /LENGTH=146 /DNA_ID=CAMNT_0014427285 /DNA_START=236 /DNA_END=674 /DNA_ORIENTATION=+